MKPSLLLQLQASLSILVNAFRDGLADGGQNALSVPTFAGTQDAFIVVFKESTTRATIVFHLEWLKYIHFKKETLGISLRDRAPIRGGVKHTFDIGGTFLGYSGQFDGHIIEQVAQTPEVRPSQNPCHPFGVFLSGGGGFFL